MDESEFMDAASNGNVKTLERILQEVCPNIARARAVSLETALEQTCNFHYGLMDYTPLHAACDQGQIETVAFLLKSRAQHMLTDKNGSQPLHVACGKGFPEIVQMLVNSGASLIHKDTLMGDLPIHWAASKGHVEVIKVLVQAGADLKAVNKEGWSPIHRAAFTGHHQALEYMINKNGPIDSQTLHGDTPLHLAARNNFLDAVHVLAAKCGARKNICNNDGLLAEEATHNESVRAIIRGEVKEMPKSAAQDPLAFILSGR
uniref:Uncharacterized protein n=1 Tax=Polyblepharides amylifera TaxID=1486889 RepID=A0A7R9SV04_9CHLO|mmetsp:Transcript_1167/g.1639  ORF Transcript_1167/g.1639 Transcript_1167/m.1639 type:complete len:260 (+) Transcript_1167:189-968(+)|eukprot:CAMPEP_0196584324 /NCGR_PEP_ID=MMETSP1081-20130531/46666_1 /TAXON_ID=36882 /ORGANISM="Pyramimonas amylifera, Strain CCMP720" /LENGTH=259 /DNA_ID=CAMNT_0041905493 /DNA_START=125 /DNA_END=904 /DNA_ORIENTATION=-